MNIVAGVIDGMITSGQNCFNLVRDGLLGEKKDGKETEVKFMKPEFQQRPEPAGMRPGKVFINEEQADGSTAVIDEFSVGRNYVHKSESLPNTKAVGTT